MHETLDRDRLRPGLIVGREPGIERGISREGAWPDGFHDIGQN